MNSFDIRVQYSKGQIIKILNHFNHFKDIKLTTDKYHVCKGQVYRWRRDRTKYEMKVVDGNNKRMGKPGRRALFPDLEQELYNNIILHDRHVLGDEINGQEVRRRMMELVETRMDNHHSGFSASSGWLKGWMKRFNVVLKRPNASIDEESVSQVQVKQGKLISFKQWYVDLRDEYEYKDSLIINMDETPVWYEPKVCKVVEKRDVDLVVVKRGDKGDDRARVTAVLAVSRDGTMLQPTVIHKSKSKAAREQPGKTREEKSGCDVALYKQESNCMTSDIMVDWVEKTLVPHVERVRSGGDNVDERCLLIMDSFSGHRTAAVKETLERHGIDVAMIPGGMTKHLQPLDIAVNRSFKSKLKGEYWKRKRREWRQREGEEEESSSSSVVRRSGRGRPRKGQVSRAAQKLEWIVEDIGRAARLVDERVVRNGWRKMEEWRL